MKKVILLLSVLLALFLTGCGNQVIYMCLDGSTGGSQIPEAGKDVLFICPDGSETSNITDCTFEKQASISKKEAETKSVNFVNGYVQSNGWRGTLVNVYSSEGDFFSQIVISKYDEQSFETIVKIDGTQGTVNCEQNCLYIS